MNHITGSCFKWHLATDLTVLCTIELMKHVNHDHLGKFALAHDAAKSSVYDESTVTVKNLTT